MEKGPKEGYRKYEGYDDAVQLLKAKYGKKFAVIPVHQLVTIMGIIMGVTIVSEKCPDDKEMQKTLGEANGEALFGISRTFRKCLVDVVGTDDAAFNMIFEAFKEACGDDGLHNRPENTN